MSARLPNPGGDVDSWGNILNAYLAVAHNSDGTLQAGAVQQAGAVTSVNGKTPINSGNVTLAASDVGGLTQSAADNRYQIQGSPTTAPITDKGGQVFNVKAYGALGNGAVNDTSSFNSAMSAASGATLYIPPGTYVLTPGILNNIPTNTRVVGAGIGNTILKLANAFNNSGDLFQIVSVENVEIGGFTLDGNSSNQTGNNKQYGFYLSTSTNCVVHDIEALNWTGDGIQLYNDTGCMVSNCFSHNNGYHGFEVEQCVNCTVTTSRAASNAIHGLMITPGEVGSTGSQGNHILGCSFDNNSQYGICVNWDNAGSGAHLSEGNIIIGNSISSNAQYGVCFYGESHNTFTDNFVYNNGFFGLYVYQSAYNRITNNYFHNNSAAANGGYDEIAFEGATSGYASAYNTVAHNTTLINGTNKARYAINELNAGDGPNIVMNNIVPSGGTAGTYNIQNTGTQLGPVDTSTAQTVAGTKTFSSTIIGSQGYAVAANATLNTGMGMDAPFGTAALRIYNPNSGGNIQVVAPSGSANYYIGGNDVVDFISTGIRINDGYNLAAGTATGMKIGTANNQKLGFFNVTPVIQPVAIGTTTGYTVGTSTSVTTDGKFTGNVGTTAYTIGDVVNALKELGLLAS